MKNKEYEELKLLVKQLENVGTLLVGSHYDFSKDGTTFNFTNKWNDQFAIKNFHDGKNYNVVIEGPKNKVTRSQFKPVDTAYLGFMMRKVEGSNNYSTDA